MTISIHIFYYENRFNLTFLIEVNVKSVKCFNISTILFLFRTTVDEKKCIIRCILLHIILKAEQLKYLSDHQLI